jgi:hypothetical protein
MEAMCDFDTLMLSKACQYLWRMTDADENCKQKDECRKK